ncbi:antibiotic biosynthesis monooxygenase family protein [Roseateles sp.]|jgi:heme-degrading monooxygenase HmoA|uniref:antibiotic biosynthesis monooxygenase family protein n=1 Tax=Roseateles sp. TaxID=1971397 RepID=UPI0037C9CB4E
MSTPELPPGFAARLQPPYYAVIFTSQRTPGDAGYGAAAAQMAALAAQQPGYLGAESARDSGGLGLTVSYWRSMEDIAAWRRQLEHAATRDQGRAQWYSHYELRVARVERAYGWDRQDNGAADPGPDYDLAP